MNPGAPASGAPAATRSGPCAHLDPDAIKASLHTALQAAGLEQSLAPTHPHLFSAQTVLVTPTDLAAMRAVIQAVEEVIAHPAYVAAALRQARATAQHEPKTPGAFLGFDFHLDSEGPKLIEINTNAGGMLLGLALLRAHLACCVPLRKRLPGHGDPGRIETEVIGMLRHEWRAAGHATPLTRVAIVDDDPTGQFLYPEFVLFQKLLGRHGIETVVADPTELAIRDRRLWAKGQPIDLVYNRLTDFALEQPAHATLRSAYLDNLVVVTPHPRAHALYADKRNLALLTDRNWLAAAGVTPTTRDVLIQGIATTRVVAATQAEQLWTGRKRLFFKPVAGFGSKAVYRGDKLTRRVWEEILSSAYVAQELVPPAEQPTDDTPRAAMLKSDVRHFVYRGETQLVTARLYQGQTTNFRTPGGGFAPVFLTEPAAESASVSADNGGNHGGREAHQTES